MRSNRLPLLVGCFFLGVALGGVPPLIRTRGWAPLVALSAPDDPPLAVERLAEGVDTFEAILTGLRVDPATREFVDDLRGNLGSMDLQGFYETLPDSDAQRWRRLRLSGRRSGTHYDLGQTPQESLCRVAPDGPLGSTLGDLALEISARPVAADPDGNYLAHLALGFGSGHFSLDRVQAYFQELGRLIGSCDPNNVPGRVKDVELRPGKETRLELLETSPGLRAEDMEVLGVLAEAYPHLFGVLRQSVSVDDVLVYDPSGSGDYHQFRIRARLRKDLLEPTYPELSEYLEDIGPLFRGTLQLADVQGRNLLRLVVDTKELVMQLDGFVRDGRLLPVEHGRVLLDAPADPEGMPRLVVGTGKIESDINGIVTKVDGIRLNVTLLPRPDGLDMVATMRDVPQVSVSGSAFGFLPTWAIDVVIPGNMEELTTEFLSTACKGNGGRGTMIGFSARQPTTGPSTLATEVELEVLNSALVSLAFRVMNLKLLPDEEVREEIWELLRTFQAAFEEDLNVYGAQVRQG